MLRLEKGNKQQFLFLRQMFNANLEHVMKLESELECIEHLENDDIDFDRLGMVDSLQKKIKELRDEMKLYDIQINSASRVLKDVDVDSFFQKIIL